nr:Putative uncharacterized protein [Moritella viscosa]
MDVGQDDLNLPDNSKKSSRRLSTLKRGKYAAIVFLYCSLLAYLQN